MKVRIKEIIRPTGEIVYKIQRKHYGLFWMNEKYRYVKEGSRDYKYIYSITEITATSESFAKWYAEWISQGKEYVIGETHRGTFVFLYRYYSSCKEGTYYVGDMDINTAKEIVRKFINKNKKLRINIINI